jgi:hypothetical protein
LRQAEGEWFRMNGLITSFSASAMRGTGKRLEAIPEYQRAVEMSDGDQDPTTAALAHLMR